MAELYHMIDEGESYAEVSYSEKIVTGLQRKDADSDSIEVSKDGLLTALKPGEAVIVANVGGFTVSKRVSIISASPKDADGDGLSNRQEETIGTNPFSPDSDGDGTEDMIEVGDDRQNPLHMESKGPINALNPVVITLQDSLERYVSIRTTGGTLVSAVIQDEKYFPFLKGISPSQIMRHGILDMEVSTVEKQHKVTIQAQFQLETGDLSSFVILSQGEERMEWKPLRDIIIKQGQAEMTFLDNGHEDSDPEKGRIRIIGFIGNKK